MAVTLFRTFIIYIVVIIAIRLMGKRQIGELEPSELVVTIMISELAAMPMQDLGVPAINGIVAIFALLSFELGISLISLKSGFFRNLISGSPSVLVSDGVIIQKEMKKNRLSLEEFMEELRIAGCTNVKEIHYAILENSGKLSIIKKAEATPLTRAETGVSIPEISSGLPLVCDGRVLSQNIKTEKLNRSWLKTMLREKKIDSVRQVYLMYAIGDKPVVILKDENSK